MAVFVEITCIAGVKPTSFKGLGRGIRILVIACKIGLTGDEDFLIFVDLDLRTG